MSSPSIPKQQRLTDGQKFAAGLAIFGMLLVGVYGLVISYWTVRERAVELHMPLPSVYPIGVEGGMVAVLALDLVLTWIGRPIGWLRQVARLLAITAIGINAGAGLEYGAQAVIMHALAPAILIVGVEALRTHLLRVLAPVDKSDPIPLGRWLLAPLSTMAMRRRMILWQQPRYSDALNSDLARREAVAGLRRAFGRRWARVVPAGLAYRLRVGVRLDEAVAEVEQLLADHYVHTEQNAHTVTAREVSGHDVRELPARAPVEPVWVRVDAHREVCVGGDRVDGHLDPGDRELLPVMCAHRAHASAEAAEVGARAVADLAAWQQRERTWPLPSGGGGANTHTADEQAARPTMRVVRADAQGPRRVTERIDPKGRTERENQAPARVVPAARARRAQGDVTRARIAAHIAQHPDAKPAQIAEALDVSVSTVNRHLSKMRD
ncbi:DUF2637 domain-containing protein [Nocardiopsis aegyptia]|uniref:DUF2637 domain-containing protein n=1 Tax=Nocardiopsis aegyptia TaxID=220378 RepID=UPI00366F3862